MKEMNRAPVLFSVFLLYVMVVACHLEMKQPEVRWQYAESQYPVEICNHRYNKSMTYCDNCDCLIGENYMPILMWYLEKNIRGGVFTNVFSEYEDSIGPHLDKAGVINFSLYCNDYSLDSSEMMEKAERMRNLFRNLYGRFPSTYSYSGGEEGYSRYMVSLFTGGRGNMYGDLGHPYTFYGYDTNNGEVLGSLETPDGTFRSGYDRYLEMLHYMSNRWCDEVNDGVSHKGGLYGHHYTTDTYLDKMMDDVRNTYKLNAFITLFLIGIILDKDTT